MPVWCLHVIHDVSDMVVFFVRNHLDFVALKLSLQTDLCQNKHSQSRTYPKNINIFSHAFVVSIKLPKGKEPRRY